MCIWKIKFCKVEQKTKQIIDSGRKKRKNSPDDDILSTRREEGSI